MEPEQKEFIMILDRGLEKISKNYLTGRDYLVIALLAKGLIETYQGNYKMPVDVDKIVKEMGINVYYQAINRNGKEMSVHKLVGTIYKRPDIITGKFTTSIIIDSESRKVEQRFALAHEFAHYLIHSKEEIVKSAYYLMPMLFVDMEEMIADIFATFLLIPLPKFFPIFFEYIEGQDELVQTSEWLRYLSIVSEVPYEDVAIGYEYLRFAAAMLYQIKKGMKDVDKLLEGMDSEVISFVKGQIQEINDNIIDEMEKKLFCNSLITTS